MVHLDLPEVEAKILRETLQSDLARVRLEFGKTESRDWRQALKEKEDLLMRVLENLQAQLAD